MTINAALLRLWLVAVIATFSLSTSQGQDGYCPENFRELPPLELTNHCINLRNNFLTTKNINISEYADLSIVTSFKTGRIKNDCLNVVSYQAENECSIRLEVCSDSKFKNSMKFTLAFDHSEAQEGFEVNFKLSQVTWYKLGLVFKTDDSYEVIIMSTVPGVTFSQTILREDLNHHCRVSSDGYFSFGSQEDSNSGSGRIKGGGLWIDEISYLSKAVTINDLKGIRDDMSDEIFSVISFSEGRGRHASDEFLTNRHYIIGDTTHTPLWRTCPSNKIASTRIEHENETLLSTAEEWCMDLIYHDAMVVECGQHLAPGVAQKFYADCVNEVANGGSISMAIHHLQSYAEYCELSLCPDIFPLQPMCDIIPTRLVPPNCFQSVQIPCYSGQLIDGACQCYRGWFGRTCSNVCPGGVETPCGGIGQCEQLTGECLCPINFNQTTNCMTCTTGFFGENCSIYRPNKETRNDLATASIYGFSRILTFDGLSYNLRTPGEFVFFDGRIRIYIKHMSRSDNSGFIRSFCGQIWIKLESVSITVLPSVQTVAEVKDIALILVNGTLVNFEEREENSIYLEKGKLLRKISDDWLEVNLDAEKQQTKKKPGCHYIRINVKKGTLNLYLTCWKRRRRRHYGRAPRGPSLSEFIVEDSGRSPKGKKGDSSFNITANQFVNQCRLLDNIDREFVYTIGEFQVAPQQDIGVGNCLRFVTSNDLAPLNEEQSANVLYAKLGSAVDINTDLSVEMYMKSEKDGIFFTYSPGSDDITGFSLALTKGDIMLLIHGGDSIDVSLPVPQRAFSTWGQLTINCRKKNKVMWLQYTDVNKAVYESKFLSSDVLTALSTQGSTVGCESWFTPQGSIVFGQSEGNTSFFSGSIDELRIWNRVLSTFEVKQNFGKKIVPSHTSESEREWEPKMTSAWTFDEGRGKLIKNLVPAGSEDMISSKIPNNHRDLRNRKYSSTKTLAHWTSSDAPLTMATCCRKKQCICNRASEVMNPLMYNIRDKIQVRRTEKTCSDSLNAVFENPSCVKALGKTQNVFVMQCVEDMNSANTSDVVETIKDALAALCRFTLNLTDPCLPNPCKNEGKCGMVDGLHYRCECKCGFTGKNCETDIDECEGNPCGARGLCRDEICGFSCDCQSSYVGKFCQRKCSDAIGLESGAIEDAQLKASSEYQTGMPWYISYLAERARLNRIGWGAGWVPRDDDDSPWLQISFLEPMRITGISLQGVRWNGHDIWTTKFGLNVSDDSTSWMQYGKELSGNDDSMRTVHLAMAPAISTHQLRIIPLEWHMKPAIRMELYGCPLCDCCRELGMESFFIQNSQITASSVYGANCSRCSGHTAAWPHFGRLDGPRNKYADFNLWMASKDDLRPWIMVDLLRPHNVNGVIVQGGNWYRYKIFVTAFAVQYSIDNEAWTSLDQVFEGNQDFQNHRKVIFKSAFQAQYVKITLIDWRTHPGLRFEVLGCSVDEYF